MNAELVQLIQLQALDLQIQDLTRRHNDFPRHIESLNLEIKNAEKTLSALQEQMEHLRKERRRLEGEVEVLRAKLSKYKEQLMAVKTNKEYTAVLSEIETCNKEITSKEDEVLAIMEKMESQEKAMKEGKYGFASKQDEIKKRRTELQNQMQELGAKLQNLESDRGRLLEGISSPLLRLYSRIAGVRKGVALAEARDYSCQVCHVRLRPQMFNEVKKNEQIITCESCNRILYFAVNQP